MLLCFSIYLLLYLTDKLWAGYNHLHHIHHSQGETERHSKVNQWEIETERCVCREDYKKKV